jgi:hypothetical protein
VIEPLTFETLTRPVADSGYVCSNFSVSSCFALSDRPGAAGLKLRLDGTVPLDEKSNPANKMEYIQVINASPDLCYRELLVPYL